MQFKQFPTFYVYVYLRVYLKVKTLVMMLRNNLHGMWSKKINSKSQSVEIEFTFIFIICTTYIPSY